MQCRAVAECIVLAKGLPTDKETLAQSVASRVCVGLFRLEEEEGAARSAGAGDLVGIGKGMILRHFA
jgi:hypothetical protein